jgi:hypothetical protein
VLDARHDPERQATVAAFLSTIVIKKSFHMEASQVRNNNDYNKKLRKRAYKKDLPYQSTA